MKEIVKKPAEGLLTGVNGTNGTKADNGHLNGNALQNVLSNYKSAVNNGFYEKNVGGLFGKYDNVRRYWEDQITRFTLKTSIEEIVARRRTEMKRIHILDLGSGAGEGYEIISNIQKHTDSISEQDTCVLPDNILGSYTGVDISPNMVKKGTELYSNNPKVKFCINDLSRGLDFDLKRNSYDIFFSSYGSLSHLRDDELEVLVNDICDSFEGTSIFVADLMGKYSFEWQCYWDETGIDETNMRQYSMSYLYPDDMLDKIEVERFPLRYWGSREFDTFFYNIMKKRGVKIIRKRLMDRSILVGRHMNTREFNPHAQPIRGAVNSLFEFNYRTKLDELLFDYAYKHGYEELNAFFERYQMAWNAIIYSAIDAIEHWNDRRWLRSSPHPSYPKIVKESINTIKKIVRGIQWFRVGDMRANIFEPQLGYILRNLEIKFQRGLGSGHGLLAVYELQK